LSGISFLLIYLIPFVRYSWIFTQRRSNIKVIMKKNDGAERDRAVQLEMALGDDPAFHQELQEPLSAQAVNPLFPGSAHVRAAFPGQGGDGGADRRQ
jgi:hypothetical protein